jgi:hypothetical protein
VLANAWKIAGITSPGRATTQPPSLFHIWITPPYVQMAQSDCGPKNNRVPEVSQQFAHLQSSSFTYMTPWLMLNNSIFGSTCATKANAEVHETWRGMTKHHLPTSQVVLEPNFCGKMFAIKRMREKVSAAPMLRKKASRGPSHAPGGFGLQQPSGTDLGEWGGGNAQCHSSKSGDER